MVATLASASQHREYMKPFRHRHTIPDYVLSCRASSWVRSAEGEKIQKKLWDETIEQLASETGLNLQSYV